MMDRRLDAAADLIADALRSKGYSLPEENTMTAEADLCVFECHIGDVVRAEITAVLDGNGEPTTLPAIPAWGSNNLEVAVPRQGQEPPGNTSILIDAVGVGECDIILDTGVSPEPGQLVQGLCHLTVKPNPGPVRTVNIALSLA